MINIRRFIWHFLWPKGQRHIQFAWLIQQKRSQSTELSSHIRSVLFLLRRTSAGARVRGKGTAKSRQFGGVSFPRLLHSVCEEVQSQWKERLTWLQLTSPCCTCLSNGVVGGIKHKACSNLAYWTTSQIKKTTPITIKQRFKPKDMCWQIYYSGISLLCQKTEMFCWKCTSFSYY